jgi:hypothetical protein
MTGKEDARAFAGESTGSCAANSSAGSEITAFLFSNNM